MNSLMQASFDALVLLLSCIQFEPRNKSGESDVFRSLNFEANTSRHSNGIL